MTHIGSRDNILNAIDHLEQPKAIIAHRIFTILWVLSDFSDVLNHHVFTTLSSQDKFKYWEPIGNIVLRDCIANDPFGVNALPQFTEILAELQIAANNIVSLCNQAGIGSLQTSHPT